MERVPRSGLGLLNIECRLSDTQPIAGKDFTLTAFVQNPFDAPLEIIAVRLMVPAGLSFVSKDRGIDQRKSDLGDESLDAGQADGENQLEDYDGNLQLGPGDTLVHMFTIHTSHWFFSSTEEREVQLVVSYVVADIQRRQAETIKFTTRTRVISPILGSIVGGFLGCACKTFVANQGTVNASWDLGWQSIVSIVFAIVATLMVTRRLGTQSVFTVEDVYGGFFLGFLVGYLGRDFFESLIPAQDEAQVAQAFFHHV